MATITNLTTWIVDRWLIRATITSFIQIHSKSNFFNYSDRRQEYDFSTDEEQQQKESDDELDTEGVPMEYGDEFDGEYELH